MKEQWNNKGFSLIELLITVAISTLVSSALFTLMIFSSNSMSETQKKIFIQDEAKNIVNHITGTSMEASEAEWVENRPILVIRNEFAADPLEKEMVYWLYGSNLFFASTDEVSLTSLPPDDKNYLLGEHVVDFGGTVEENPQSQKKILNVNIKMMNKNIEFECNNQIFIRNQ